MVLPLTASDLSVRPPAGPGGLRFLARMLLSEVGLASGPLGPLPPGPVAPGGPSRSPTAFLAAFA